MAIPGSDTRDCPRELPWVFPSLTEVSEIPGIFQKMHHRATIKRFLGGSDQKP